MKLNNLPITLLFSMLSLSVLSSCTSVTIDEYKSDSKMEFIKGDTVVVLGRRHSSDFETEPSLIDCVGNKLDDNNDIITVIPERLFIDSLYPWFEPRTAPMKVSDMQRILKQPKVRETIDSFNIRHIVWINGNTETTKSSGSIGCSIGVGGAGCFGFGTWEKESDYEAVIWDYDNLENMGQISADAEGTSYMPAIIVPIPIIARVQNQACQAMGQQLRSFLLPSGATNPAP